MFIPDASLPSIREEREDHFLFYPSPSGFQILPLTGFGGIWLSEITGKDAFVTLTPEAAANLMAEFYLNEQSPTLD